jgi:hypothetical protein
MHVCAANNNLKSVCERVRLAQPMANLVQPHNLRNAIAAFFQAIITHARAFWREHLFALQRQQRALRRSARARVARQRDADTWWCRTFT